MKPDERAKAHIGRGAVDDITALNETTPLHDWLKQELDKRLEAYDNGELNTFDSVSVHESLREKYR